MGKLAPFLFAALLAGCADEEDEYARFPPQRSTEVRCVALPHAAPGDSFWQAEAASEANTPRPLPRHSVSLGYAGDGVLSGGITRDTPVYLDQPQPQAPQYYPQYYPQCLDCGRYPLQEGVDPPYQWHFAPGWRYRR